MAALKISCLCELHHVHGPGLVNIFPSWLCPVTQGRVTMPHSHDDVHEYDRLCMESTIQRARQRRAEHMNELIGPILKAVGAFAFVAVVAPWHTIRHLLTTLNS